MANLKVFLKNRHDNDLLQELELDVARQYTVGRGEDCDIVLPSERGISRHHFKLSFDGSVWQLNVLSRYGELYFQEQMVSELCLKENLEFSIPPLSFVFSSGESARIEQSQTPVFSSAVEVPFSLAPEEERTQVIALPQTPFLRLTDGDEKVLQVFRLTGEDWVAGRDTSCSIFIDHERVSRKHFEIKKQEHIFLVRDLGSANGTVLNGQPLKVDEWKSLNSGDVIQIGDRALKFELKDSQYEERVHQAHSIINTPAVYISDAESISFQNHQDNQDILIGEGHQPQSHMKRGNGKFHLQKKHWVRVAIGVTLAVAFYFSGSDDDASKKRTVRGPAQERVNRDFSKLKPEQQEFVRQTHKLAKDLLMQGRYEMARQEILKIQQFVANFEDSKEIENTAVQGIQLQQDKARADAKEREKLEVEQKIRRQLQVCKAKVTSKIEVQEIDDCLSSVIQFNPEHSGIQELKNKVDQIVTERNIREAQKADYAAGARKQQGLFNSATALNKKGKLLQAVKAYQKVQSSRLPDPQNYKGKAQREIASIQQTLAEMQAQYEMQAEGSYKNGQLKEAISFLKKAVEINPENEVTKSKVATMLNELRKQMQTYYQEGILEESVGEVESAKAKWKKIIDQSLPEEEYHKKATIKLKKYGAL
jgi:pSer/pThr/pTyr-binding forkhead associated (FHA) protein